MITSKMKKLKQILLVDDSDATNFFNKAILGKLECVEEIIVAKNGKEALDIFKSGEVPDLIFLDINMPIMNGWEFIKEYQKIEASRKTSIIVLMLGTKLKLDEEERVKSIPEINEYFEKMLTKKIVCYILNKYFNNVNVEKCKD